MVILHSSELTRESQKPSMAISTRTSNFSLPVFKWGIRKQLRFIKPDPSDDPQPPLSSRPENVEENEDQKQKLREEEDKEEGVDVNVTEKTMMMMMVSNRRTRSGTCRFSVNEIEQQQQQLQRRPKFSISLSRREIEDDLFGITGNRPSQRPKKRRPKMIQKKIDVIFPGLWLADITADSYTVAEDPENGKARDCRIYHPVSMPDTDTSVGFNVTKSQTD